MGKRLSKEDIKALIDFLPVFTGEGFDPVIRWGGGELLPDGARTFPWPVYHEAVESFFQLAGKEAWSDFEYTAKDVPSLLQVPGYIEGASLDEIKTILTFCVRGERFCDGHWAAVIRQGLIQRLLLRLAEILEEA